MFAVSNIFDTESIHRAHMKQT